MERKYKHPGAGRPASKFKVMRLPLEYAVENKNWLRANKFKTQISELLTRANTEIVPLKHTFAASIEKLPPHMM